MEQKAKPPYCSRGHQKKRKKERMNEGKKENIETATIKSTDVILWRKSLDCTNIDK